MGEHTLEGDPPLEASDDRLGDGHEIDCARRQRAVEHRESKVVRCNRGESGTQ